MPPRRNAAEPRRQPGLRLWRQPGLGRSSRVAGLAAGAQLFVFDLGALAVVMHGVGQVLKARIAIESRRGFVDCDRPGIDDFVAQYGPVLLDGEWTLQETAGRAPSVPA